MVILQGVQFRAGTCTPCTGNRCEAARARHTTIAFWNKFFEQGAESGKAPAWVGNRSWLCQRTTGTLLKNLSQNGCGCMYTNGYTFLCIKPSVAAGLRKPPKIPRKFPSKAGVASAMKLVGAQVGSIAPEGPAIHNLAAHAKIGEPSVGPTVSRLPDTTAAAICNGNFCRASSLEQVRAIHAQATAARPPGHATPQ